MSTKERVVRVETVTESFCDICGAMIGDGLHDGGGGTNFWGKIFTIRKLEKQTFEMSPSPSIDILEIRLSEKWNTEATYSVCRACAVKVIKFIEDMKK